ncbi:hypothetical protein REIP_1008 [Rickettsia endosymbiont of Ixodes pacificus]|nr:hypothetical protein REIP_1008 [Rickettsia endosymbiont of Ixodes pacificus]
MPSKVFGATRTSLTASPITGAGALTTTAASSFAFRS